MPLPGPDKWWYSFDFGPIHFLQYSTEHDFALGENIVISAALKTYLLSKDGPLTHSFTSSLVESF